MDWGYNPAATVRIKEILINLTTVMKCEAHGTQ